MSTLRAVLTFSLSLVLLSWASSAFGQLDSETANASMNVGKFAKIKNLSDFQLLPDNSDGDEGSVYSGFDMFNVLSNTAISVSVSGGQLSNGSDSIATTYSLDEAGIDFSTPSGVHNAEHKVSAEGILGDISDQEAGQYSAQITITVAALP